MSREIVNAKITRTSLSIEDHGILTVFIHLDYGGSSQGFGGYALDTYRADIKKRVGTAWGAEYIRRILEVLEVDTWEKLPGQIVRVERGVHLGDTISAIGHVLKEQWFDPKEDRFLAAAKPGKEAP